MRVPTSPAVRKARGETLLSPLVQRANENFLNRVEGRVGYTPKADKLVTINVNKIMAEVEPGSEKERELIMSRKSRVARSPINI